MDENGNPISPSESGNQPAKDIPGYTYVHKTNRNGDTIYTYTKNINPPELPDTGSADEGPLLYAGYLLVGAAAAFALSRKRRKH